jgi:tripeptidyl-peptidase-1
MYGIGADNATFPGSKQAAAGFLQQYASLSDLSSFFSQFDPQGAATPIAIIGPNDQSNPGMEADLDVQYIMGIGAGVNTTYWCVPCPLCVRSLFALRVSVRSLCVLVLAVS